MSNRWPLEKEAELAANGGPSLVRDLSSEIRAFARHYPNVASRQLVLAGTAARLAGATSWFTTLGTLRRRDRYLHGLFGNTNILSGAVRVQPEYLRVLDRAFAGHYAHASPRAARRVRAASALLLHELIHTLGQDDRAETILQINRLGALHRDDTERFEVARDVMEGTTQLLTDALLDDFITATGLADLVPHVLNPGVVNIYPRPRQMARAVVTPSTPDAPTPAELPSLLVAVRERGGWPVLG